jgi:hypothetical protein
MVSTMQGLLVERDDGSWNARGTLLAKLGSLVQAYINLNFFELAYRNEGLADPCLYYV